MQVLLHTDKNIDGGVRTAEYLETLAQGEGMVIGGFVAKVEAHEGDGRRSVRQQQDVAGDQAQMLRVPGGRPLIVGRLEHHMPQAHHVRRLDRRSLRRIDARRLTVEVPGKGAAAVELRFGGLSEHDFDVEARWIRGANPVSSGRIRSRFDGGGAWDDQASARS